MRFPIAAALLAATALPAHAQIAKPAAITADGVPIIPAARAEQVRPYLEARSASAVAWNPVDRSLLISTRFANVAQLHSVRQPLADRRQITFEADRIGCARYSKSGDVLVVSKDIGGGEFFQLYTLKDGRLSLITDGKSRNQFGAFSKDGKLVGYSSTRRNGTDSDLYVVDPRNPKTDRLVAQVKGGGWGIADFAPDGKRAVVAQYLSVQKSVLYDLDLASGKMTPITDPAADVAYGDAHYAPDGTLWVLSDEGSDVQRLGTLDPKMRKFTAVTPAAKWDVDEFAIADDGAFIAYVVNEDGVGRVKLLDPKSGQARDVTGLPAGVAGGLEIAPWGAIGLTVSSATVPGDAYSIDPQTLAVTRWTESETGGLDPASNVAAELVRVKSFDGEMVSGFLYRPDAKKFPGRRPLLIDIHGGPEGQTRPSFRGTANYYLNELGIALFYPNVRGSTGFGKRFVSLDNGPFKREDSVKDIGAFLTTLKKDRGVDAAKIGVQGGSYGGYMCYASAIRYGADFKGALCTVAISNFVTFLENTQSYRRDLRRVEYGDERDAQQKAKLIEISPITRVKELKIPLMVVTGANDPRVPKSEADQMVAAVRANGGTAWHLVAADEGHGYAKKENRDYSTLVGLTFWQTNLLGEGKVSGAASPIGVMIVPVTAIEQNCTLLWCTATMKAAVIDPGGDMPKIKSAIAQAGVTVEKVLLTHGHIDHAGEAKPLADELGVEIEGPHEDDRFWLARLDEDGKQWGIRGVVFEPDRWLVDGDTITVGDLTLDVYHTPGHTAGHVIFHHAPSKFAQVGDVLFQGSVGRTDLPQGNHKQLIESIVTKLWPLGDETAFIPGHGKPSTFAHERQWNMFVSDSALSA